MFLSQKLEQLKATPRECQAALSAANAIAPLKYIQVPQSMPQASSAQGRLSAWAKLLAQFTAGGHRQGFRQNPSFVPLGPAVANEQAHRLRWVPADSLRHSSGVGWC